ncbi:MAG: ATPase [Lachnospiraceae bacterium]|nr:ATPase [Lachnospiraceae bacterium]
MSSKRIEQAIEDIYEYIELCKPKGFSSTQIIVQKDELLDKLDEMKLKIPDEVARCAKILERRDEILREAELKAQKIIEDANVKAEAMVHDSEIMRQAYLQANEFIARANQQADETLGTANYEAEQIRSGAFEYTKDMLLQIENVLSTTLEDTKAKSEAFVEALSRNLEIVTANRKELCDEVAPAPIEESDIVADIEGEQPDQYENDNQFFGNENDDSDGFNVDSDAFMRDID